MDILKTALLASAVCLAPIASAQTQTPPPDFKEAATVSAYEDQDYCITVMGTFPGGDTEARYQFYKLVSDMGADATPDFRAALQKYGEAAPDADTPLMDVIEVIANPVIRQAAPEIVVSNMGHLIDFNARCAGLIEGQILSLSAYDSTLFLSDEVISQDALYLRQILSESLDRLGAAADPQYGYALSDYAASLVTTRDAVEYAAFETEIDDLESLFMNDLDGRLARSNDIINEEADRNVLADAITLSKDMSKDAEKKQKQDAITTLFRILGGY